MPLAPLYKFWFGFVLQIKALANNEMVTSTKTNTAGKELQVQHNFQLRAMQKNAFGILSIAQV